MRKDMNKVLVERPRRGKEGDAKAARWRNDFAGPVQLGMRAGYGYRNLNENLSPLRRYLRAQVGRPWNKVYSEIASGIDRRNTVQQHVYQHIDGFIAVQVKVEGDRLIDLRRQYSYGLGASVTQDLYVDPCSGLIRVNKRYGSFRRKRIESERRRQAGLDARRRIVDECTQLHKLDENWFRVEVAPLPEEYVVEKTVDGRKAQRRVADWRFDVLLKRATSRLRYEDRAERMRLYGANDVYAVSKRQMSRREIKGNDLR